MGNPESIKDQFIQRAEESEGKDQDKEVAAQKAKEAADVALELERARQIEADPRTAEVVGSITTAGIESVGVEPTAEDRANEARRKINEIPEEQQ